MSQGSLETKTQSRKNQTADQFICWVLYGLSGGLLIPFWWLLARVFLLADLSFLTLLLTALTWLVWTAVVVFALIMVERLNNFRLYLAIGLGTLGLFLFFPFRGLLLLAAAVFFLGLFVLQYRFAGEERFSTRLFLRRILPRALPPFFTLLALAIAVIYFTSPLLNQGISFTVPRPLFNVMVDTLPFQKEVQALGISKQQLYQQINQEFQTLIEPYRSVIPLFFVIGVALTLKALSYPTIWLLVLIEGALLRLLLRLGLVHKETRLVKKETFRF